MNVEQLKQILSEVDRIAFRLPNGKLVPKHFHVTEVGRITKKFIDCGGTTRAEEKVSLQLWSANDYNHRLHPEKLIKILNISEREIHLPNEEIEVEYQGETIEKYSLEFTGKEFQLVSQFTDCLAKENCGIPLKKPKIKLSALQLADSQCSDPNSDCC